MLRLLCVLIGLVLGYGASLMSGLLPVAVFTAHAVPWLAMPRFNHAGLSFDTALALPYVLAALISTVKAVAVVTTCQRTNNANYIRPDLASIDRGVLADGIVTALGGLIGTVPFNASTSAVGLAAATGITSRRVAYAMAAILAGLAFSPACAAAFAAIPGAVAGAILVFSSCFVISSGIEVMASRLLNSRRMLAIAGAILAAEGAQSVAASTRSLPHAVQQIANSPLLLGATVALVLNMVLRLGTRRNAVLEIDPANPDLETVRHFMDSRGAAWGARRDVIDRAGFVLSELVDTLVRNADPLGGIRIETSFNEFQINLKASYRGALMAFPATRPSLDEIANSEDGLLRLSGYLVRRQTDGVRATRRGDTSIVELTFEH